MSATTFLMILTGVLLNAAAQLLLKAGTNSLGVLSLNGQALIHTALRIGLEPHIIAGLGCYVISVGVWIFALSRVEVSMAYPMLSIGYVVNALAAWYLFGEVLSTPRLLGIGTIILGVFLVSRS